MKIHSEGKTPIMVTTIMVVFLLTLFFLFYKGTAIWLPIILCISFLVGWLLVVRFFRVPERVINKVAQGVISPADGTIVAVEETVEQEYFNDKRLKISIFMSIYNVHVNYFPIDGEVEYVAYHPGKYLIASYPKSSTNNEHNTVVVKKNDREKVLFRQIAGFVARRIVCSLKPGDVSVQGEEMGMIRFGSRVDVFLPLDVEVVAKPGDKVKAQKTVLAYF